MGETQIQADGEQTRRAEGEGAEGFRLGFPRMGVEDERLCCS